MGLEIMHIDMDAFFASVEQLDNPELRGKPVIVGGVGLNNRGVVSTASYEARKYGVHSAMPIIEARRLCPNGIFLPGRRERYQELSQKIFSIFEHYTPVVEKISIDEAFLDLTGCHRLFGSSVEIGKKIKEDIKRETGLIASVGLAPNKFLAKLASDLDKPDGFFIIKEDKVEEILEALPIGKLWGVGKKTEIILKNKGINNIALLKKLSLEELEAMLGKIGKQLYFLARGIDNRKVEPDNEIKSISHEETYSESLSDKDLILSSLLEMSERVTRRLRKKELRGSTVFVKIRYDDFTTYTRRVTLNNYINNTDELYKIGRRLLEKHNLLKKPLRLLGIGVGNLTTNDRVQLSLFTDRMKEDDLTKTIDLIKDKFGDNSIKRARTIDKK